MLSPGKFIEQVFFQTLMLVFFENFLLKKELSNLYRSLFYLYFLWMYGTFSLFHIDLKCKKSKLLFLKTRLLFYHLFIDAQVTQ